MADGRYVRFVLLIVLSALLVAGALSSPMRKPPPGTKSIESLLSGEHGGGPVGNEPGSSQLRLIVTGASHTHYLRLRVYIDYRDGKWVEGNFSREGGSRARPFIPTVPHHTQEDRITVVSSSPLTGNIYTAIYSFNLSVPSKWCVETGIFSTNSSVSNYSFGSFEYTFDPYVLINLTAPEIPRYLRAPADERLRELAERITSNLTSDYERAEAIVRYLRDSYNYSAGYPRASVPVEEFLFGTRRGESEDFAAAFVILAREIGLPARLVEGIRIKALPFPQTITEKNRWFWAEVYFNGAGWLTFDPLSGEDPNVFRPFEMSVNPRVQKLNPNDTAKVNLTVENVAVEGNITLTVGSPKGWFQTTLGAGEHTINLGKFQSPGMYSIIIDGSVEVNGTPMGEWTIAWLEAPGRPRLTVERYLLQLTPGDARSLKVHVNGTTDTHLTVSAPFNNARLPFPWTLTPANGTGTFDSTLILNAPWRTRHGWYIFNVKASTANGTYILFLPMRIITPPNLMVFSQRSTVDAGRALVLSGSTDTDGGEVYATLTYGGRLHVVGTGRVRNGSFLLNCRIPPDVSPGYRTINVHYIPVAGSPVMKGFVPLKVYVRGTSRISIQKEVVFTAGPAFLGGSLHSGSGSPIKGNLTYYLDGKPLGNVTAINGRFEIALTLRKPGMHTLRIWYGGNEKYQGTTADVTVIAVRVEVRTVNRPLLGKKLKLEGYVDGIGNGVLRILTASGEGSNVTVKGGSFSADLGPLREVGRQTIGVYWGRTLLGSLNFTVLSPTEIRLLNTTIHGGDVLKVPVLLTDGLGRPIAGVTLNAEANGEGLISITNGSGIAVFNVPLRRHEKNLTITVTFSGAGYYLPAKMMGILSVKGEGTHWEYLIVPTVISALLILARRRTRNATRTGGGVAIVFPDGVPLFEEGETVEFETNCEAEVYVNGKFLGTGRRFQTQLGVGEHGIEAVCGKDRGRARVRVVARYNHGIAELYEGCFLRWVESTGVRTMDKTPREILLALNHSLQGRGSLKILTKTFERARYGREKITRREFIEFYHILRRTVRGECYV